MEVFYTVEDQYTSFEAYLSKEHREHLHKNGLSDAVIDSRPYYSIDDNVREYLVEDWGFPEYKVEPEGLVIPRYQLGIEEAPPQIRYDVPASTIMEKSTDTTLSLALEAFSTSTPPLRPTSRRSRSPFGCPKASRAPTLFSPDGVSPSGSR